jgi:hypothetical protein
MLKELQVTEILMAGQVHLEINLQDVKHINKFNLKLSQNTAKLMNNHKEKWKLYQVILDHMIE